MLNLEIEESLKQFRQYSVPYMVWYLLLPGFPMAEKTVDGH